MSTLLALLLQVLLAQASGDQILVEAYVESLCSACRHWVLTELRSVWNDETFRDRIDLKLYPFGNANFVGTNVKCQHGVKECDGNAALACAKKLLDANSSTTFTFCLFEQIQNVQVKDDMDAMLKACAPTQSQQLIECTYGVAGKLETAYAAKATIAVQNKYTPWVTVDGQHSKEAERDLKQHLCSRLSTLPSGKPAACKLTSLVRRSIQPHHPVCPNPWHAEQRHVPNLAMIKVDASGSPFSAMRLHTESRDDGISYST